MTESTTGARATEGDNTTGDTEGPVALMVSHFLPPAAWAKTVAEHLPEAVKEAVVAEADDAADDVPATPDVDLTEIPDENLPAIEDVIDEDAPTPSLRDSDLEPVKEDADLMHRLIIGDNLPVLQALEGVQASSYDLIYIDPPYNTGKNFIYHDKRYTSKASKDPNYRHTSWREFMKPRLVLARELMKDDGVIFVSIDDNEHAYLKVLMDEVFGSQNFLANIIWQKSNSTRNDAKYFSVSHEYVLVYHKGAWKRNLLPRTEKVNMRYKFDDGDGRGPYAGDAMSVRTYSARTDYPVTNPNTGTVYNPPNGRTWMFTEERFREMVADNRIFWGAKGTAGPSVKKYLSEVQQGVVPTTWWSSDIAGTTTEATKQLRNILGGRAFDYTKPVDLISAILRLHTNKDAQVLDFFAGSGTTGQAVAELNLEDGGNRVATLVTNNESDIATNVTYPRLKRVLTGQDWADDKEHPDLNQGLIVFELDD